MGKKLVKMDTEDAQYGFHCPGCRGPQMIPTAGPKAWGFNGSLEAPTFTPSILSTRTYGYSNEKLVCHSFVRDGKIEFLSDCTHSLAGQTVELKDVETFSDLWEKLDENS